VAPRQHDIAYPLSERGSRLLALRSLVGLSGANPEDRTTEIHIGYTGEWEGHGEGPFKLTPEDLQSCIENFEARTNPIAGDYEHASLNADGEPKPASMYIQALRTDGKNLYATAEFTPRAAKLIRDGEYRYNSGVFAFNVADRVAGGEKRWPCVLRSCALTNDPFLDGQQPIALTASRALSGGSTMAKITKAAIIDALKAIDGDELTETQFGALGAAVSAMAVAQDPKAGEKPADSAELKAEPPKEEPKPDEKPLTAAPVAASAAPPPPADPMPLADPPPAVAANADAATMVGAKLVEATGLEASALLAALETNLDAVVSAIRGTGGQIADLTAQAAASGVAALTARLASLAPDPAKAAADREAAIAAEVDALVADGSILPGSVQVWRDLAAKAPANYRALKDALPKGAAFPTGRDPVLSKPDANLHRPAPVDETRPEVRALRAMCAHLPKADADAVILTRFGTV
jgi:phage I-like protein